MDRKVVVLQACWTDRYFTYSVNRGVQVAVRLSGDSGNRPEITKLGWSRQVTGTCWINRPLAGMGRLRRMLKGWTTSVAVRISHERSGTLLGFVHIPCPRGLNDRIQSCAVCFRIGRVARRQTPRLPSCLTIMVH